MTYLIEWYEKAEHELAEIWMGATDRKSVTATSRKLDRILAYKPLEFGESRTSSVHRVGHEDMLGVEYEVVEDDKKVNVFGVWLIRAV